MIRSVVNSFYTFCSVACAAEGLDIVNRISAAKRDGHNMIDRQRLLFATAQANIPVSVAKLCPLLDGKCTFATKQSSLSFVVLFGREGWIALVKYASKFPFSLAFFFQKHRVHFGSLPSLLLISAVAGLHAFRMIGIPFLLMLFCFFRIVALPLFSFLGQHFRIFLLPFAHTLFALAAYASRSLGVLVELIALFPLLAYSTISNVLSSVFGWYRLHFSHALCIPFANRVLVGNPYYITGAQV